MRSKKINNSKYKNTGVLFELLVRQITADTLAGKPVSEALDILKKYFNASTELGKEMQLYRAFFESGKLTETKAIHFIDLVLEQRKKLDERKLAREKYDLIKEIKATYSLDEFLSTRINNYTVYASIYKTFANQTVQGQATSVVNISEVAAAKFTLVEHLLGSNKKPEAKREDELINEFKNQTEDLRLLTYKLAVDKFNHKYSNLNDKQKALLREYIENVSNTHSLLKYVKQEIPEMRAQLTAKAKTADKITGIKLNEVASQLEKIGAKNTIRDNEVTAMMIAYEIIKEV